MVSSYYLSELWVRPVDLPDGARVALPGGGAAPLLRGGKLINLYPRQLSFIYMFEYSVIVHVE